MQHVFLTDALHWLLNEPDSGNQLTQRDVQLSYFLAFVSVVVVVSGIYAARGFLVVLRIVLYLASLATVAISLKVVFVKHHFHYPQYLSFIHFICTWIVAMGILLLEGSGQRQRLRRPSLRQFGWGILPIAASFAASVGSSNLALLYANVGFVEMIGCCTPFCVVVVSTCMGHQFNSRLFLPVAVVCIGIALCARGELKYSVAGFLLAFLACVLRAIKSTLQGCLLATPDLGPQNHHVALTPVELLIWTSLPSILIMFTWSLISEGLEPHKAVLRQDALPLLGDIALSCVLACLVNVLGLYMMRDIGVLGSQLTGQLKSILTVLGGVALLGEAVGLMQIWGFACILLGVFWHNRIEADCKPKEPKEGCGAPTDEERVPLLPAGRAEKAAAIAGEQGCAAS